MSRMIGVTRISAGDAFVLGSDDEPYYFDRNDYPSLRSRTSVSFVPIGSSARDIRTLSARATDLMTLLHDLSELEPAQAKSELTNLHAKIEANAKPGSINIYAILNSL